MNLNNVNKPNTREWCLFNGNSKSQANRDKLVEKHGGSWEKGPKYWIWNQKINKQVFFSNTKKKRNQYIFTKQDGTVFITDNFDGFCREHNLTKSAMGDVLTGKRKQHKGFVVTRMVS